MKVAFCSFLLFLGRLCISAIFLFAGLSKFMDFEGSASFMESKGMTMIPFFLYAAAIIEILGALSLILGYKTRLGAFLLLAYLVPVTLIMHDFWNVDEANRQLQMIHFLSNLAIFGGLLYVVTCGSGNWCCSHHRSCEKENQE